MKKEKETITEALGLKPLWKKEADKLILYLLDNREKISDIIEEFALDTKQDEFGDGDYELTSYEKKLILGGFIMGQTLLHRTMRGSATEALIDLLSSTGKRSHLDNDLDED